MGALRPAFLVDDAQHPRLREFAPLTIERAAMDRERGTELVLLRQPEFDQLHRGDALPRRIVFGVHEHGHARREVGDLPALAHDRDDVIDLLGVAGWGR